MCKLSAFAAACASGQNCVALSKDGSSSSDIACGFGFDVFGVKLKASS